MKPKRQIIPTLSLGQNFRLVMSQEGIAFKDISKKARVSQATAYRLVERTPIYVTDQVIKFGKSLGFTERQIRDKTTQDRLLHKVTYSKKERLYQLVGEIIDLFDSK